LQDSGSLGPFGVAGADRPGYYPEHMEPEQGDQRPTRERLVLSFSPLPQDAWSEARDVAEDAFALRVLRRWGEHLARAIQLADRLAGRGWRLRLQGDLVIAEKHADRSELAALARELKGELRTLTVAAEDASSTLEGYLSLNGEHLAAADDKDFHPLIDG